MTHDESSADDVQDHSVLSPMIRFCRLPRQLAIALIAIYQRTLSPDHGWLRCFFPYGCCVYAETCSQYGKRVIGERGVLRGVVLTVKRILHCTPWRMPEEARIAQILSIKTCDAPLGAVRVRGAHMGTGGT